MSWLSGNGFNNDDLGPSHDNAEELNRIKRELHQQVIAGMDLSSIGTMQEEELRIEVRMLAEGGSELRHVIPEGLDSALRWLLTPQGIDDAIRRQHLAGMNQQEGEQCTLLRRAKRQSVPAGEHLGCSQYSELDIRHIVNAW